MTKILFTIGRLNQGGAEQRLLELITHLKNTSYKFSFYILSGKRGVLDKNFLDQGAELIYAKKNPFSLYLFLKKNKHDVVHSNVALASGLYLLAAKYAGVSNRISHIRTVGSYNETTIKNKLKNYIFKILTIKNSTKIIGVCSEATKFAPESLKETIYNGIKSYNSLSNINRASDNTIICLGRMHAAKNFVFAVDVLNSLNKNENWSLDFYGDENKEIKNEIIEKAIKYNLINKIKFCGHTTKAQDTLSRYSLLLLPSVREGLPGVVLESISVGTPVVATALPGCKEISQHLNAIKTIDNWEADEWAQAIKNIVQKSRRSNLIGEFSESPFIFDNYVNKIIKAWGD